MTTKAMKEHYRIGVTPLGYWAGQCPACDAPFTANSVAVSQAGVIAAIQQHETEAHGEGL